ncbi:vacuolar-sorting protein SNF8-like [Lytechinus pictus]|uniref:vacuolar-sorting protein SNF8-like n=1 Tax=Lytechinus variegatus TaxID=7654 RepID=UPI001BB266AD|nr:vacuolar-sorting protein SNF8-like [Lytechinus variegatus]XP_041478733.1 vacuolar-sorting protein SNF8-like [Lytechinus variegatus]XP_054767852.1 vacuolar-sorting protein SNF8-like [Lytechinus pictus]
MRRAAGLGKINKQKLAQAKYKDKGSEIAEDQLNQMSRQLEVFRTNLEEFAANHKSEIKKNPEFRMQFQDMCATIGVDPLASGKGFWSEMLGVGDFYYEIGVQIIEVCLATQHRNGGLMNLEELLHKVRTTRGKTKQAQDVSLDDIIRAIKKLKVLGNGFGLHRLDDGRFIVQSVPAELSMDHTSVLNIAQGTGCVSLPDLQNKLKWEEDRARLVMDQLVKEGLVWVDDQDRSGRLYWFPGLFPET